MTKIERAEKAILQMKDDGRLPEDFEIRSMTINEKRELRVIGKSEKNLFYWFEIQNSLGTVLATCVWEWDDVAIVTWDEEAQDICFSEGWDRVYNPERYNCVI